MQSHVLTRAGALAVLVAAGTAAAAVVQRDAEGGVVTISGGLMMKEFATGEKAVFDSRRGLLTAVFPERGIYTTFTRAQFCGALAEGGGWEVEDVTASLYGVFDAFPGGRRFHVQIQDPFRVIEAEPEPFVSVVERRPTRAPGAPPLVRVVDKGPGGTIAGYPTRRYHILVDGALEERVWMAENEELVAELAGLDMALVLGFFECDETVPAGEQGPGVDADPAYRRLFERGLPLRIESGGDDEYYRVVSVELERVPPAAFGIPKRLEAVPFSRRLLRIDDAD